MMAYKNNFAVAIKHNGKILREVGDLVYLPFGSEYSVILKNKNSRKAVVDVEIDGQDVLDGSSIIVPANERVELKGFMRGSSVRNRFKFIEKTKKVREYRGDRIDDSLVRVEYRFEKQPQPLVYGMPIYYTNYRQDDLWDGPTCQTIGSSLQSNSTFTSSIPCCYNVSTDDRGITVNGSEVKQDFTYGSTDELEAYSDVITLQLVGREPIKVTPKKSIKGKLVKKPLTVKSRVKCETCGTKSRPTVKYCRECGTYIKK